jgi:hypothetical protein
VINAVSLQGDVVLRDIKRKRKASEIKNVEEMEKGFLVKGKIRKLSKAGNNWPS